jgi:hypothetical protein
MRIKFYTSNDNQFEIEENDCTFTLGTTSLLFKYVDILSYAYDYITEELFKAFSGDAKFDKIDYYVIVSTDSVGNFIYDIEFDIEYGGNTIEYTHTPHWTTDTINSELAPITDLKELNTWVIYEGEDISSLIAEHNEGSVPTIIYDHPLNINEIKLNLKDMMSTITNICELLKININDIMTSNTNK